MLFSYSSEEKLRTLSSGNRAKVEPSLIEEKPRNSSKEDFFQRSYQMKRMLALLVFFIALMGVLFSTVAMAYDDLITNDTTAGEATGSVSGSIGPHVRDSQQGVGHQQKFRGSRQ